MTDPTPNELRGRVLRAWRDFSRVTSTELARRVHVAGATLSQWELGRRSPNRADVERMASALELSPAQRAAMVDMWQSAGAITDGMPRRGWWHNFQDPHGPVWVWVRYPVGCASPAGLAWWGEPFQGRLPSLHPSQVQDGLIVSIPVSVSNPALTITLDEPGWVNFGTGEIPRAVADSIDAAMVEGPQIASLLGEIDTPDRDHPDERLIRRHLPRIQKWGADLGLGWHLLAPHIAIVRSDRAPQSLDGTEVRAAVGSVETYGPGEAVVPHDKFRRLRESRGFSREAASVLANQLDPDSRITHKMLIRHETEGILPSNVRYFVARLDTVYGADGRLGVDTVEHDAVSRSSQGKYTITFPPFWVGPVWLRATSDGTSPAVVDLSWGPWRRRQRVRPGAVLTTRRATRDDGNLIVRVPPNWRVTAGVGVAPAALDINRGWFPASFNAALRILGSILAKTDLSGNDTK